MLHLKEIQISRYFLTCSTFIIVTESEIGDLFVLNSKNVL